ncbi:hydroxymethylglutaryl-CoA lyase [Solibacillus sp. FSL K6-1523]|uniref:hydroxymethylglutaryl-CoA lyase n=1 Tax=Solibacillus sp. FSL K6-1523 TaxID=2921471 RepID=UPI0030F6AA24
MIFPKEIEIIEVGPRDGLQNEPKQISTEQKKQLISQLYAAGIERMETVSFVNPKLVPQMADSAEIAQFCNDLGLQYIALTPNVKAIDRAIEAKVPQIAVFVGASSTFNQKNINKTTSESLIECKPIFEKAKKEDIFIRAYVSMAFTCPYEGHVSFSDVVDVCKHFIELGADEIDIGDTNGKANPKMVYERFSRLKDLFPETTFVGHFHDTQKMALENVLAAMQAGVTKFDSSIGGLGGCPFSPGATGNVSTEELVRMLTEMGCQTNLDVDQLLKISPYAKSLSSRI